MSRTRAGWTLLLALTLARSAWARDDAPSPRETAAEVAPRERAAPSFSRAPTLRFEVGLFGPLGFGGLSHTQPLGETVGIDTGFGYGLTGFQVPLMLRFWIEGAHIALGPSVSALPDRWREDLTDPDGVNRREGALYALWLNAEGGGEVPIGGGFTVLLAGGVCIPVVGNGVDQEDLDDSDVLVPIVIPDADDVVARHQYAPYGRFAIGRRF